MEDELERRSGLILGIGRLARVLGDGPKQSRQVDISET